MKLSQPVFIAGPIRTRRNIALPKQSFYRRGYFSPRPMPLSRQQRRPQTFTTFAESEWPPSTARRDLAGHSPRSGRDGPDTEVASASREPWIDANGHVVAYERALYPDKPVLLGYRPDDRIIPFDTLELRSPRPGCMAAT